MKEPVDATTTTPIKTFRTILHIVFCWKRRSKTATLILMQAIEQIQRGTARTPNFITCWISSIEAKDRDGLMHQAIATSSKAHSAVANA